MRSVWFFLIFPTAYFLHVGYSESLFLALGLGCILAARVDRWRLAGLLGAFCWMTRGVGIVLVPALAIEAIQQYRVKRRWNWRWLSIAMVPVGFAVYLLINWRVAEIRLPSCKREECHSTSHLLSLRWEFATRFGLTTLARARQKWSVGRSYNS